MSGGDDGTVVLMVEGGAAEVNQLDVCFLHCPDVSLLWGKRRHAETVDGHLNIHVSQSNKYVKRFRDKMNIAEGK